MAAFTLELANDIPVFILYLNIGNWNNIGETKHLKSQVRCGKMGNRMGKRHMVNNHNSFAGIIQQTRLKRLDTCQPCGVHEGKIFLKKQKILRL